MINFILKLFIKDYENTSDETVRNKYGTFSGIFGIVANLLLFIAKLIAGILTNAISAIADAFNNLTDAASSIVTLIGFKLAGKKSDKEHPFGHGRMEYIAGLIVAFIIILVGFELLKGSFDKILHPENITVGIIPIIILALSIAVKLMMALLNKTLGKRINSTALIAVATDSVNDCIATSAVIVGLVVTMLTGFNPDGYIGLLVAFFIIFSGIMTAKETLSPLIGVAPDIEYVNDIKNTVLSHEEILGIHDLIVHDYGPTRTLISLHAEVSAEEDILKTHDIIDIIEMELKSKFKCDCTIHMDPVAKDDEFSTEIKVKIKEILHSVDNRLTYHDFRYVAGPTHTNLIFDVVAPFDLKMSDEELCEYIKDKIHDISEAYFAVIVIDKDYIAFNA